MGTANAKAMTQAKSQSQGHVRDACVWREGEWERAVVSSSSRVSSQAEGQPRKVPQVGEILGQKVKEGELEETGRAPVWGGEVLFQEYVMAC